MARMIREGLGSGPSLYYLGRPWEPPVYDVDRVARQQITEPKQKSYQAPEGCNEFNFWYGRWVGDRWYERKTLEAAEYRCNILRDAGRTKGDTRENTYFCSFFAHGSCMNGGSCTYLHRLPGPDDEDRFDLLHDCFGRERHNTDRDDMQGTGNINRSCKTLYVGGIRSRGTSMEEDVYKNFSEWGPIERFRLLPHKGVAFVTYLYRCSAEFAKEAMMGQTLGNDEILVVRWAFDDPNPKREQEIQAQDRSDAVQKILAQNISITPADYHYPADYQLPGPDAKRPRVGDGTQYPDTSAQYSNAPLTQADMESITANAEAQEREDRLYNLLDNIPTQGEGDEESRKRKQAAEYPTNAEYNLAKGGGGGGGGQQQYQQYQQQYQQYYQQQQQQQQQQQYSNYYGSYYGYTPQQYAQFEKIYNAYATQYAPELAVQYAHQYMALQQQQTTTAAATATTTTGSSSSSSQEPQKGDAESDKAQEASKEVEENKDVTAEGNTTNKDDDNEAKQ